MPFAAPMVTWRQERPSLKHAANASRLCFFKVVQFRNSLPRRSLKMQRSMFSLILASFFSMAISVALSADQLKWSQDKTYASEDEIGCSCDAPGVVGTVCATPYRCKEISGLC